MTAKEKPAVEVMGMKELLDAMRRAAGAASQPVPVTLKGIGTVGVRPLSVRETEASANANAPQDGRFARGLARLICHADGKRMFDPPTDEVIALIQDLPWEQLQKLMEAGQVDSAGMDQQGN